MLEIRATWHSPADPARSKRAPACIHDLTVMVLARIINRESCAAAIWVMHYQFAWTAHSAATLERELRVLRKVRDNFPKYSITTDPGSAVVDGICKVNIVDWLKDITP